MIMVFKVEMLLRHIEKLYPDVTNLFRGLSQAIGTREEGRRVEEIYGYLDPLNFSKDILEKIAVRIPAAISLLPVLQVTWSDWGSPKRLVEIQQFLEQHVKEPRAVRRATGRRSVARG